MTSIRRHESYIEGNFNYARHERKRVSTTDHQYKIGLCTLLFLRSLRLFADFHLGSRPGSHGFPDYVVLLYRRLDSERFKAVLLQLVHDDQDLEKVYEAFMGSSVDWRHVTVNEKEEQLDNITFVLITDYSDKHKDGFIAEPASRELYDLFIGHKLSQIRNRRKKVSFENPEDESLCKSLVLCQSRMESDTVYKDLGEEISITLNALETQKIREKMLNLVADWWERHDEVPYFTKNTEMWKAVVNSRLDKLNRRTRDVKTKLGVSFTQACLERVKTQLGSSRQVELTVADKNQGLLTRFLLHDALQKQLIVDGKTLETNLTECITLWHSFSCDGMVVDGSSGLKESTQHELLSVFQSRGDKSLVIITKEPLIGSGWITSEERTTWADLDTKFQTELLSCTVNLQGTFLPLKDYIAQDSTLPQALTVDQVLYLASKPRAVRLGQKIPDIIRYYVERNFLIKRELSETFFDLLQNETTLCAIVGHNFDDILDKFSNSFVIYSYESLPQNNEINASTIVLLDPKDVDKHFSEISLRFRCKIFLVCYERRRFHFLRTAGGLATVRDHLSDTGEARSVTDIWDINEKNIILSGPPGCGKSTLSRFLCKRAKETQRNILVLNVDMRKHRKYLEGKTFDSIHNVKSLLLEACLGMETSVLERTLFDHSIEVIGNAVILIDALDETWQSDVDNICLLLRKISGFIKYEKLIVTTRPEARSCVEEALNTVASDLPDFTREQQMTLLKQIWDSKEVGVSEEKIGSMADAASRFTSVPLLAYMLADGAINDKYSPEDVTDFPKVKLYESFIDMRINKFMKHKYELGIPEVKNVREKLMDLAAASLLKTDHQRSVGLKRTRTEVDDVSGLISSHDGTVVFDHHSFAEFFLGVWFSENFAAAKHVLEQLLGDRKFEFVRESMDWCLWKNCSLHAAVVVGDRNAVEKLLSEGAPTVDSGGRTPLHTAATFPGNNDSALWGLLTAAGVSVEQKDEVVGWTAMQYADTVRNWEMVEFLLEHGSSTDELVLLRDKSLAKQTLEETCKKGLVSLSKLVLKTYPQVLGESLDGWRGNTALHCAASSGSVKLASMLLQAGARTDATNALGLSVLCVAALCGQKDVVDFLLSRSTSIRTGVLTPLHSAAGAGHVDVVRCLLAAAVPVDAEDQLGATPLMAAAANNHAAVVQLLLRQGADSRRQDKGRRTALHWATSTGSSEAAKILVSGGGGDVGAVDDCGDAALHLATEKCDIDTVQLLLDHGAGVKTRGLDGRSALHVAAAEGKDDVTHLLLENGADVNQEDDAGRAVLHVAHDTSLAEELLAAGAAVNATDKLGRTPLHCASLTCNEPLAQLLMDRGAAVDVADKEGRTALMLAASKGDVATARLYLANHADVNARDGEGQTAVHYACLEGHTAMVKLLLDSGAQVNHLDNSGRGVILCASSSSSLNVTNLLMLLLDAGAEPTAVDADGRTAMHWAALTGKMAAVQFLLSAGLEVNATDASDRTALHYAALEGHPQVVTLLLMNGAALDMGDKDGVTPLHLAAAHGRADVMRALLDAGAAVDERDHDGNTALHFATLFSGGHLVEFILKAGASVNVTNKKGLTALHKAAANDNAGAARLLLQKGTDLAAEDEDAATALHWAATAGAVDVLRLLLASGADAHAVDRSGLTALHRALLVNNMDAVGVLQATQGGAHADAPAATRRKRKPWLFCC